MPAPKKKAQARARKGQVRRNQTAGTKGQRAAKPRTKDAGKQRRGATSTQRSEPTTAIIAFTADQICKLAELSKRQLGYWDKTDFFSPRLTSSRPYTRIYSFRDLVGLRVISTLRNVHQVPLQRLRVVGHHLKEHADTPWSELTFYVSGRHVYFEHPGDGVISSIAGQVAGEFALVKVAFEMGRKADELRLRSSSDVGRIDQHRFVAHNEPVVAGTRIPVRAIVSFHEAGRSAKEIVRQYPRLTVKDVEAAIAFDRKRRRAG